MQKDFNSFQIKSLHVSSVLAQMTQVFHFQHRWCLEPSKPEARNGGFLYKAKTRYTIDYVLKEKINYDE